MHNGVPANGPGEELVRGIPGNRLDRTFDKDGFKVYCSLVGYTLEVLDKQTILLLVLADQILLAPSPDKPADHICCDPQKMIFFREEDILQV